MRLGNNLEGSEEVHSVALLIGVGDELSIELLVAWEADATDLLVLFGEEAVVSIIDLLDVREGRAAYAVQPVLINADDTVTININSLKGVGNETLECSREISVGFATAVFLNSLLEFFNSYLAVLVEVSELSNLIPEIVHDLGVGGVGGIFEHATSLDEGGAKGKADEVILVKVAIVINVVHVPDDEFDTVVPGVSHFSCNLISVAYTRHLLLARRKQIGRAHV